MGPAACIPALSAYQNNRRVALRIEVYDKHALIADCSEAMSKHRRNRRFTDTALAVGDCEKNAHRASPVKNTVATNRASPCAPTRSKPDAGAGGQLLRTCSS